MTNSSKQYTLTEEYDSIGRIYNVKDTINNKTKKFYSVTTMLSNTADKAFLDKWKAKVGVEEAKKQTNEAVNLGTHFHKILQEYIEKEQLPATGAPAIVDMAFIRTKKILDEHVSDCLCEVPLWSTNLELAGRCDCIGHWDGEPAIIDFKLVKTIYPPHVTTYEDYKLQCVAYSEMVKERTTHQFTPKKLVIIMARKDGCNTHIITEDADSNELHVHLWRRIKAFREILDKKM